MHSWQRCGRSAGKVIYDLGVPEVVNIIKKQSAFKNEGNSKEQPNLQARLVDAVASDDSDVLVFGARFGAQTWTSQ